MNTEKFSSKASNYEKGRPSYPRVALEYLKTLIPDDAVIADIGAGTGKFTKLIAELGYDVFAVEPNGDMFCQLQVTLAKFPNAKSILATSENTTLADGSVNVITVAQALHWFDLEKFKRECHRILQPNGWVVALYNNVVAPKSNIVLHDGNKCEIKPLARKRVNAAKAFFRDPLTKEFRTAISYTQEMWVAFMMSHSHSPVPSDDHYPEYTRQVHEIFAAGAVDGMLKCEVLTTVYAEEFRK